VTERPRRGEVQGLRGPEVEKSGVLRSEIPCRVCSCRVEVKLGEVIQSSSEGIPWWGIPQNRRNVEIAAAMHDEVRTSTRAWFCQTETSEQSGCLFLSESPYVLSFRSVIV